MQWYLLAQELVFNLLVECSVEGSVDCAKSESFAIETDCSYTAVSSGWGHFRFFIANIRS